MKFAILPCQWCRITSLFLRNFVGETKYLKWELKAEIIKIIVKQGNDTSERTLYYIYLCVHRCEQSYAKSHPPPITPGFFWSRDKNCKSIPRVRRWKLHMPPPSHSTHLEYLDFLFDFSHGSEIILYSQTPPLLDNETLYAARHHAQPSRFSIQLLSRHRTSIKFLPHIHPLEKWQGLKNKQGWDQGLRNWVMHIIRI